MDAVRITDVSKTFGKHTAVSDLSLTVPQGALYGFIGPNGSGKTTTIRMILRIIQPDRGEIEVLGAPSAQAANDELGYLPEERGLYKKMSVRRMLSYYAALKGHGATVRLAMLPHESHGYRARESVMHMLWEMTTWLDTYVKNSGPGERPVRARAETEHVP